MRKTLNQTFHWVKFSMLLVVAFNHVLWAEGPSERAKNDEIRC